LVIDVLAILNNNYVAVLNHSQPGRLELHLQSPPMWAKLSAS